MTDADFNAGTRSQPLGDAKAGVSADLDALAAYVASLNAFDAEPAAERRRHADAGGRRPASAVFTRRRAAQSATAAPASRERGQQPGGHRHDQADSGQRLGGPLTGIDMPTLRDVWATAPYLHDGSAATLGDAIRAHAGVSVTDAELAEPRRLPAQIGSEEGSAPGTGTPNTAPAWPAATSTT